MQPPPDRWPQIPHCYVLLEPSLTRRSGGPASWLQGSPTDTLAALWVPHAWRAPGVPHTLTAGSTELPGGSHAHPPSAHPPWGGQWPQNSCHPDLRVGAYLETGSLQGDWLRGGHTGLGWACTQDWHPHRRRTDMRGATALPGPAQPRPEAPGAGRGSEWTLSAATGGSNLPTPGPRWWPQNWERTRPPSLGLPVPAALATHTPCPASGGPRGGGSRAGNDEGHPRITLPRPTWLSS